MDAALETAYPPASCPHVAMLVTTPQEVAPALAAFYALGARRNGWLLHRSLAGRTDADRARLTAAGLDVAGLEADGRMAFNEITADISLDDYVHVSDPEIEAALARGFDAPWCSRFPIGPDPEVIDRTLEYDRAWNAHAHANRYVSLCVFIVDDPDRDRRAAQLAAIHDTVLRS